MKARTLTVEVLGETDEDVEQGVKAVARVVAFVDGTTLYDEDGREL